MKSTWFRMAEFSGIIILLLLSFGKIVEGHCSKYLYELPNRPEMCDMCRICPDYMEIAAYIQPGCHDQLSDGRKVQCSGMDFIKPACTEWKPEIGSLRCSDNNSVYSSCSLRCPRGFKPSDPDNITCLAEPHLQWSLPLPFCQNKKQSDWRKKHGVLSGVAIFFMVVLFLLGPWCILICLINWNKKQEQHSLQTEQAAQNPKGQVVMKLINAVHSQRCYVLRNKWIAKDGTNVMISATPKEDTLVVTALSAEKAGSGGEVYTAPQSAPSQIVLHSVSTQHPGRYNWIADLSDGTSECGVFFLEVKVSTLSGPSGQGSGFGRLMKNRSDVQRLCVLFDQEEVPGVISWRTIAVSPLLDYDMQQVKHDEYHLKGKPRGNGPTMKVLTLLHQKGTTIARLTEFLQEHMSPTSEPLQILNKYL
ncbi:uncharacterized protein LOC124117493 [Haliotis rufescens]|uniref:uncharacterized protein LOC124117493 n=1 Tax=Haliotis rufescens TaxID=6454 RepID=UPI00201E8EA2|nr:uncharacterized protein LOC124117493 [Haliotis rufescens]XP_046335371.2 uncharacterized protein LOC124117493 [Haliotis rufescens]XP_046335372.2 uncharacterized protein LOC124117493 [Haliotis rufescens]XP_048243833.1 uncharacterized protein LOC124117493 [Haliotis rufescens]